MTRPKHWRNGKRAEDAVALAILGHVDDARCQRSGRIVGKRLPPERRRKAAAATAQPGDAMGKSRFDRRRPTRRARDFALTQLQGCAILAQSVPG